MDKSLFNSRYTVKLVARNEGIEYRDENGVHRFDVGFRNKKWFIYLPGTKGEFFLPHTLTPEERLVVIPRIERYLARKRYFGFFGPTFPVVFDKEPPVADHVVRSRQRAAEYWRAKQKEAGQEPSDE